MFQANRLTSLIRVGFLTVLTLPAMGMSPADDQVEFYLRANQMDQLLEVQLEDRLDRAGSNSERAEIAERLSRMYLNQLHRIGRDDPYRSVVLIRARSLVERVQAAPMYELRLELLVDNFVTHENAIELYQLRLLDEHSRSEALGVMVLTKRELVRMLAATTPELNQLIRRRASMRSIDTQREIDDQIELFRRLNSFGYYYLGWTTYGIAVLEDRHVGNDGYEAFGWLLGAEGAMPQSKDLHLAAVEFEHVARAAVGVAMCYAQSDAYQFASAWLDELLEQEDLNADSRSAAMLAQLRVHVRSAAWYDALETCIEVRAAQDAGALSVADARYVIVSTLESPRSSGDSDAERLVQSCIRDLVDQREIGHIVELYQRFEHLPLLGSGFIPNYARALAELERVENAIAAPNYMSIAELLTRSLRAADVDEYPDHRDDCRLKLAYTYVRADRPKLALQECESVLSTSLDRKALEEAHWIGIAALDRANALSDQVSSQELEQAISDFINQYPDSGRTRTLVLRYAINGGIDEQLAIETLAAISEDDSNAISARRLQIQLQFKLLRRSAYTDMDLLRSTRDAIRWVIERSSGEPDQSDHNQIVVLQIGIDLALRDVPPDPQQARRYIEQAKVLIADKAGVAQVESELIIQLIRAALIESNIGEALSQLDQLRSTDPSRFDDGQLLILNTVVERWGLGPDLQTARDLIEVAVPVLGRTVPAAPEKIGVQQSALIEVVIAAAVLLDGEEPDPTLRDMSMRMAKQVLERGQPSEQGLRRTAELADALGETPVLLDAWLRLLAAYPIGDDRWFEARFHSLAAMKEIDPPRAFYTFQQFRILNPSLGPAPWNERIAALFSEELPESDSGETP